MAISIWKEEVHLSLCTRLGVCTMHSVRLAVGTEACAERERRVDPRTRGVAWTKERTPRGDRILTLEQ
jgi:hypothetical protein